MGTLNDNKHCTMQWQVSKQATNYLEWYKKKQYMLVEQYIS